MLKQFKIYHKNHVLSIQFYFSTILALQTSRQKIPVQNLYCIKDSPFTFPVQNGDQYYNENRLSPSNEYFFWNWYKRKRNNIAHGNLNRVFFPSPTKQNVKYTINLNNDDSNSNSNSEKLSLTINNCNYKDADDYSLRIQNKAPEEILARYRLNVIKKPDIPKITETHSLPLREVYNSVNVQNELVLATCETISSPKARIEWYRKLTFYFLQVLFYKFDPFI